MVDKIQREKHSLKEKKSKESIKKRSVENKTGKQVKKKTTKKVIKKQADDKSARVKKANSARKLFTWTILIAIIVGILIFLYKSEMFNICNIEIKGNNQISQEKILELSGINLNANIFLTNINRSEKQISENTYIKEVTIKRILPDKIKIEIIEKEKAYMVQVDENVAYLDKNGYILEISPNKLDKLIMLQGYSTAKEEFVQGSTLNEEDLKRLQDVQQIIKSSEKMELHDKITSINIKDKNDYILNLHTYKKIVYIGDTSNLSTKMLRTKDIIEKTTDKEGKIFVNGKFSEGFDPYFREELNNQ